MIIIYNILYIYYYSFDRIDKVFIFILSRKLPYIEMHIPVLNPKLLIKFNNKYQNEES